MTCFRVCVVASTLRFNASRVYCIAGRMSLCCGKPEKRGMGVVFQSYAVWPHMTVAANVEFPLKLRGMPVRERRAGVSRVLEMVGLKDHETRPATRLSGDEQQRYGCASVTYLLAKRYNKQFTAIPVFVTRNFHHDDVEYGVDPCLSRIPGSRPSCTAPTRKLAASTWQVLPQDAYRASELLSALSTDQQSVAIIGTTAPGDVVAGPGRQASLSIFQGIPAGQLDDAQQRLLWLLLQEFVRNADFDAAEAQLALIQQTWGDVHFAWQGPPPDPSARFYFRVHGPRVLIEYDVQQPLTNNGGHVHGITRDPTNDYGTDWLGLHYQESSR